MILLATLARRLVVAVPILLIVSVLLFVALRILPVDPAAMSMPPNATRAEIEAARHAMRLDRPLPEQYAVWLDAAVHGDFGTSIHLRRPVLPLVAEALPATVELGVCAILFAMILGLPLGVIAAVRRGSPFDYGLMGMSVTGASMPIFWWGLMMILVFSVALGWTPVSGRISDAFYVEPWSGFMLIDCNYSDDAGACASAWGHLILPMIVLGTIPLATIARMTRSSMLEVLNEDYIRTARAKGLNVGRVVIVHALRNALIPVVTVIGLSVSGLLGGAILTETIFSWPGVGHWLVESIQRRDYPVLQGGTLLVAILVIVVNLGVDLTYGFLNPRIRR